MKATINILPLPTEEERPWANRMVTEYKELQEKYNKLHRMLVKHEAGTLDFTLVCPIKLLEKQLYLMGEYLRVLEVRAEIENISLF